MQQECAVRLTRRRTAILCLYPFILAAAGIQTSGGEALINQLLNKLLPLLFRRPVPDFLPTPPTTTEEVLCEVCGDKNCTRLFTGRDRLLGIPGAFPVVRCLTCGLVNTNPRPDSESLAAYYPSQYGVYAPEGGQAARLRFYHNRIARRLGGVRSAHGVSMGPRCGRILDIGCGDGTFLELMQRSGWDATGLEMDALAAGRARARGGLNVVQSTVEDAAFPPGEFDLVTLSHLLEHVPHPRMTLRRVRSWMSDEGLLFITLPNVESWERRYFRDDWYPWDVPRHLYHFDRRSLGRLLDEEGFEVVETRFLSGFFVPQSLRYRRETVRSKAEDLQRPAPSTAAPEVPESPTGRNSGLHRLKDIAKTAVYCGLLVFADLTGRFVQGEILEVTARKKPQKAAEPSE